MLKPMRFLYRSRFRCSPEELFRFHERPDALQLLTPPWAGVKVLSAAPSLHVGAEARLLVPIIPPFRVQWHARHVDYEPPHRFVDEQVAGPFKRWRHEHRIEPVPGGAELIDQVDYEPPLGPVGKLGGRLVIPVMLKRMFAYRHAVTKKYVER
jgi:ligand-binding SRPBCC domain-containing protein